MHPSLLQTATSGMPFASAYDLQTWKFVYHVPGSSFMPAFASMQPSAAPCLPLGRS